jgi:hypothetical protein
MTGRAGFAPARSTGATIESKMARGDTCEVTPRQSDRLAAEVVSPYGGGLQPQGLAHPHEREGHLLLRGSQPLQVLLILAEDCPGLPTTAVLSLRELVTDLKEVS